MPAITPLLRAFLTASETRVELLAQQERDRLAEREQLVAEREAAQGKIDLAQRNVRRVQRRWASVLLILTVLVVLGTGAGLWVVFEGWRSLMVNRSEFIAGIIDRQTSEGDHVTAMLLGLEALPDPTSESIRQRWLPVEMTAMHALDGAWRNWRTEWGERAIFDGIQIPSRPSSSRPTARASSPAPGTTRRGSGTPPPANRSQLSPDIQLPSRPSPSRPTARASSPAPRTTRRGSGTPPPANRSQLSPDIQVGSPPSSSRPTARASSPAPRTTRRDCGVFSRPFRT